jgi:hypothetical protein
MYGNLRSDGDCCGPRSVKHSFADPSDTGMAQFVMAAYYILWWPCSIRLRIQRENGFVVAANGSNLVRGSIYYRSFFFYLCVLLARG